MPKPREQKSRTLPGPTASAEQKLFLKSDGSLLQTTKALPFSSPGYQITGTEGHKWPPKGSFAGDLGGDFSSVKQYAYFPNGLRSQSIKFPNPNWSASYETFRGNAFSIPTSLPKTWFPLSLGSSDSGLDALGATAIARVGPTKPVANLATFLGELAHDGLPRVLGAETWEARTLAAKQAGSEYLNVQFGWVPLVSDIRKLSNAIVNLDKNLSQYERDAGKLVRRSYDFPMITSDVTYEYADDGSVVTFWPGFSDHNARDGLKVYVRIEEFTRRWFRGAFTYHLPTDYDSRSEIARTASLAEKLLGFEPTPDVLWELTPWSWAVDWFSNTGDVITNLSRFAGPEGLVMPYGYMMEHTIVKSTYSHGPSPFKTSDLELDALSFVTESKLRRRANPFGFGVSWDGLSSFQASILAALGLSRGGR